MSGPSRALTPKSPNAPRVQLGHGEGTKRDRGRAKPLEARWVQSLGVLIEPPASSPGDSRDGCFTRVVPAR